MIAEIYNRIILAAAWLVALFIGGKYAAAEVLSLSDSESPMYYNATRTRGNPDPHSKTIEGS